MVTRAVGVGCGRGMCFQAAFEKREDPVKSVCRESERGSLLERAGEGEKDSALIGKRDKKGRGMEGEREREDGKEERTCLHF